MDDLHLRLPNVVGALAKMGRILAEHQISLEGGGVFSGEGLAEAHFLVADGPKALTILAQHGFDVIASQPVLIRQLKQDIPGQLGAICQCLADTQINIQTQYSDHHNQLILVIAAQDMELAEQVTAPWRPK